MDTQKSLQWIVAILMTMVGMGFSTIITSAIVCSNLNRIKRAR